MRVSLTELKAKFETGDIPTGQDFIDLIDTLDNKHVACEYHRNTSQLIPVNASPYPAYVIQLNEVGWNTGNFTFSDYGIVIPTGLSVITVVGETSWEPVSAVGSRQLCITVNGGVYNSAYIKPHGTDCQQVVSTIPVSSGDIIRLACRQDGGSLSTIYSKLMITGS